MKSSTRRKQIFEVVLIAICTALLTSLEIALSILPNIQLTFLLIIVFSKVLKTKKTLIIIILHVIIDNLIMASFNIFFVLVMMIGLMIIPLTLNTIFKKVTSPLGLAGLSIIYALIYSWLYIIPSVLLLKNDFRIYLIQDLPFEGLLAGSSFLSVLWLYTPLTRIIDNFIKSDNQKVM
ncbi:MAG: hypothetical protein ACI32E_02845 [Bacilli bacterium]